MQGTGLTDVDWTELPEPVDDGLTDHLAGMRFRPVSLVATDGREIDLSTLPGRTVLYVYPMTGKPEVSLPDGWNEIPGARGCTPQSCSFRDHHRDLRDAGAAQVFGLSIQSTADQREAAKRLHLPYALLSDPELKLRDEMAFPTFTAGGAEFYRRVTLVIADGMVEKVFYPVFPPDRNPEEVAAWLRTRTAQSPANES